MIKGGKPAAGVGVRTLIPRFVCRDFTWRISPTLARAPDKALLRERFRIRRVSSRYHPTSKRISKPAQPNIVALENDRVCPSQKLTAK